MTTVDGASARSQLRRTDGTIVPFPGDRWIERVDDVDVQVLRRAVGPVLDLGCGPGRHCQALAEQGTIVLGIDLSAHAVGLARSKGVAVLERSVFESLPRAGEWGSVLLLDGNIGIGGDPARLLARAASLLRPDGLLLVETSELPEETTTVQLVLEGEVGPWFDWAVVSHDGLSDVASAAGLELVNTWTMGGRYFGHLKLQ